MSPVRNYSAMCNNEDVANGMNPVKEVSRAQRVLIASGASAGHLYPALAFAESLALKRPDTAIAFVTVKRGIESGIQEAHYQLFYICLRPLSFNSIQCIPALYYLGRSFLDSFFIIQKFRPDIVVGFGSYVSFPVLLEAALLKIHTLIHEQNISFGLSNRLLSCFVERIAVSFTPSETKGQPLKRKRFLAGFTETAGLPNKCVFTGYPLRKSLTQCGRDEARRFFNLEDRFTLLVLGGSLGSHRINTEFKKALEILAKKKENFQFIHISGKSDYLHLKEGYKYITIKHCVFDFLAAMHLAYSAADLVICRAGAGTLSELAYFKKAALVIPYPYAAGHQLENALTLKRENAAVVIEEQELKGTALSEQILALLHSADERKDLENNIQKFAHPDAADRLAELALSMVK